MSAKKDNSNSKKRSAPDSKEWTWDDTALADAENTSILASDVKMLLLTRGENKKTLKGKKVDLIKLLKEKYSPSLEHDLYEYQSKELMCELRLRKMNDKSAKKDILISRLRGEIDDAAPPAKKAKFGRPAKKTKTTPVWVTIYTPPQIGDDEDAPPNEALGVFKSEAKAYEKGITRLLADMEAKLGEDEDGDGDDKKEKKGDKEKDGDENGNEEENGDDDQKEEKKSEVAKEVEKVRATIDKIDKKKFRDRMDVATAAVAKAFGSDDAAPYCDVSKSALEIK